jgi:hypothetical protein
MRDKLRKEDRAIADELLKKFSEPEHEGKIASILDEVAQSTLHNVILTDNGNKLYVYIKSFNKVGPCSFHSKSVAKLAHLHQNHYYTLTRALDITRFSTAMETTSSRYILREYTIRELISKDPPWRALCDSAFVKMKEILATGSHISIHKKFVTENLRSSIAKAMGILSDEEIQIIWDECRVQSVMES